jgi:hypothetical protein
MLLEQQRSALSLFSVDMTPVKQRPIFSTPTVQRSALSVTPTFARLARSLAAAAEIAANVATPDKM